MSGRAVVVRDGRIQAVVAERDAPAGPDPRLDGLTLLPGLINCHVHLCFGGEADPGAAMVKETFATTVIKAALRARGRRSRPASPRCAIWAAATTPS